MGEKIFLSQNWDKKSLSIDFLNDSILSQGLLNISFSNLIFKLIRLYDDVSVYSLVYWRDVYVITATLFEQSSCWKCGIPLFYKSS